jgi:hypothetical protein
MALKYKGKDEPSPAEARAGLRQAVETDQIVFAVIQTDKGFTIYTNVECDEQVNTLFAWLLDILPMFWKDILLPKGRVQ